MDDQPLVACGHCGSRNRPTSEQCFICARPLTGNEVEVPAVVQPQPQLTREPLTSADPGAHANAHATADADAGETMTLGARGADPGGDPGGWGGTRRRTTIVAAALVACLALGAGAWIVLDEDPVSDPVGLQAAVTEEPEVAWTWEAERPITAAFPMDQGALVVLGDEDVVALDEDGEERWRRDVPDAGYAVLDGQSDVVHVASWTADEPTITALDAETGQQRWAVPGEWFTTVGDATFVLAEDELRRIDAGDGSEVWSVEVDGFGEASPHGVFGVADGELHGWDLDGEEMWVSDVDLMDSTAGSSVVALDDFIAASAPGGEVVGIDPATGDERWRDDPGNNTGVGSIEPGFAFTYPSSLQDDADDLRETTVYDRDGVVVTLPLDEQSFFYPLAIELEDEPHFVAMGMGVIYDEDFMPVGTVPTDDAYPTLTGVYDTSDGGVSYVAYGDDEPRWTIDTTSSVAPQDMTPGDEFILLVDGSELSLYR